MVQQLKCLLSDFHSQQEVLSMDVDFLNKKIFILNVFFLYSLNTTYKITFCFIINTWLHRKKGIWLFSCIVLILLKLPKIYPKYNKLTFDKKGAVLKEWRWKDVFCRDGSQIDYSLHFAMWHCKCFCYFVRYWYNLFGFQNRSKVPVTLLSLRALHKIHFF